MHGAATISRTANIKNIDAGGIGVRQLLGLIKTFGLWPYDESLPYF